MTVTTRGAENGGGGGAYTGKLAAIERPPTPLKLGCMNELPRAIHKLPGTERVRAQSAVAGLSGPAG